MPMNGVCDLELRQLIEGAFLPARCEVSCSDGLSLTLHFAEDTEHEEMTITGIRLSALPNARALADLVSQVREEREALAHLKRLPGIEPVGAAQPRLAGRRYSGDR